MELLKRLAQLTRSVPWGGSFTKAALLSKLPPRLAWTRHNEPVAAAPTETSLKVYKAVLAEKVALIERLPSKYRQDVAAAVLRSVTQGYDVAALARSLTEQFGLVPDRAQLVAQVQCKMARSVIENAHMIEQGIKQAVWKYDRARCTIPAHAALDGKQYAPTRGVESGGKRMWPGGEPPCFCTTGTVDVPTMGIQ